MVKDQEEPVLLQDAHINRAIDGDVVVVEMLPETDWVAPKETVEESGATTLLAGGKVDDGPAPSGRGRARPTGRVVGVLKRNWRPYCGTLLPSESGARRVLFLPQSKSVPRVRIETRQAAALEVR